MNFYSILQNAFIFQLLENFFWLMVVADRVAVYTIRISTSQAGNIFWPPGE